MNEESKLFNIVEASDFLDCSVKTVYRAIRKGLLPFTFFNSSIVFSLIDLKIFKEEGVVGFALPERYFDEKRAEIERSSRREARERRFVEIDKRMQDMSLSEEEVNALFEEFIRLRKEEEEEQLEERKRVERFLGIETKEKESPKDIFLSFRPDGEQTIEEFQKEVKELMDRGHYVHCNYGVVFDEAAYQREREREKQEEAERRANYKIYE